MTDKSFKQYLIESTREYKYFLKLAIEDVTDKMKDVLEVSLDKYQLISASDFKKTPIQESPLDFPNIKNFPVFISEIVIAYPGGRDFLETYIASNLGISEQSVVIYSENDPRQIETELFLERSAGDWKDKYVPVMGTENTGGPTDTEVSEIYGEGQVTGFLKELEDVRNEREVTVVINPLSQDLTRDKLPADYDNFNSTVPKHPESVIFGRTRRTKLANNT